MPIFLYKATDRSGKIVTGTMEAKDKPMLIGKLQDLDYFPISVDLNKDSKAGFSVAPAAPQEKYGLVWIVRGGSDLHPKIQ